MTNVMDEQFERSLKFLNTTLQAVTKLLNSDSVYTLTEPDVSQLKKFQSQIKDFNIERQTHEFTEEDRKEIIRSVQELFLKLGSAI